MPDAGFAILRFKADNPGFWFVHCHFAWHNHIGMGFVIQVITFLKYNTQLILKLTKFSLLEHP